MRAALVIIRVLTPAADREFVVGDTLERAAEIRRSEGERAAARWLRREMWRVLLRAPRHRLVVRVRVGRPSAGARNGQLQTVLQDSRYAGRLLRRSPVFSVVAIAMLALGIGASTAVFSVVDGVLLRALPYQEPERLYAVQEIIPEFATQFPQVPANARHFLEWKRRCSCFEDVALADAQEVNLTGGGEAERLSAARVSANFFAVLGTVPQVGRAFTAEDGEAGNEAVAVLSDAFWHRRFGGDPAAVGQSIDLDGVPHTVVGVLPRAFRLYLQQRGAVARQDKIDVFKPWAIDERASGLAGDHNYAAIARLPPGKSPEQALAELDVIQAEIATRFEGAEQALTLKGHLSPLREQLVRGERRGLLLLFAAIGTVLLIACLNVGNLMLVRAMDRSRDTAIRAALGASGGRILRAVMIESLFIAGCGAVIGSAVALGLVQIFTANAPPGLPRVDEIGVDLRALGFAVVLAVAAALVAGALPAVRMIRADPREALGAAGRALTASGAKLQLREWLAASQVALTVMLLVAAGLLIRSYMRVDAVDRGYDSQNVLTAEVSLPRESYPDRDSRKRFYDQLVALLEGQPGIVSAGVGSVLPLRGDRWQDIVTIEGDERPLDQRPLLPYRIVSPNFLQTMDIPLQAGRFIDDTDAPRRVAVVSQRAANQLWPGESAIGKRFRRAVPSEPAFEIVGIAGDVRSEGLDKEPPAIVYVPLWERSPDTGALAIRTTSTPLLAVATLRNSVRSVDPSIPLSRVATMARVESDSTAQRRFQLQLVTAFAVSALLLATLGIYGVVAYSTSRRTHEIGLRMALGAEPRAAARMVLGQGLRLVMFGVVAGVAAALLLGRLLSALLFSVAPTDATTFFAVTAIVIGTAFVAIWIPARRAARTAPIEALRYE